MCIRDSPINDPPILEPIGNQITLENIPLEITLIASDVDNVDLIFTASSDNENVETTIRFDVLTLTPEDNWSGTANITVTVTDGFGDSEDSETFQLEVISINEPPIAYNLLIRTDEDVPVDVVFDGSDPDGDSLTFEIVDIPQNGTYDGGVYTPNPDYNGDDLMTYRAFDGTEYSSPADVVITVDPINDAPELEEIGNQEVDEDGVFEYALIAEDVDGDALSYDASSENENIDVKVTRFNLEITPYPNWNGTVDE